MKPNLCCSACGQAVNHSRANHLFASAVAVSLYYCQVRGEDCVAEEHYADPRPDRGELFMQVAELFGRRGTCLRAHVGAVVVLNARIISTGYNGAPPGAAHCTEVGCLEGPDGGCIRTTHAELNAIVWAAREGIALKGATLYSTHEPCLGCAKAVATAGIGGVFFREPYRNHSGLQLLEALHIPCRQLTKEEEDDRDEGEAETGPELPRPHGGGVACH